MENVAKGMAVRGLRLRERRSFDETRLTAGFFACNLDLQAGSSELPIQDGFCTLANIPS